AAPRRAEAPRLRPLWPCSFSFSFSFSWPLSSSFSWVARPWVARLCVARPWVARPCVVRLRLPLGAPFFAGVPARRLAVAAVDVLRTPRLAPRFAVVPPVFLAPLARLVVLEVIPFPSVRRRPRPRGPPLAPLGARGPRLAPPWRRAPSAVFRRCV